MIEDAADRSEEMKDSLVLDLSVIVQMITKATHLNFGSV